MKELRHHFYAGDAIMLDVLIVGSFAQLVQAFAPCFTAPSFQTFVVLMAGWAMTSGRHSGIHSPDRTLTAPLHSAPIRPRAPTAAPDRRDRNAGSSDAEVGRAAAKLSVLDAGPSAQSTGEAAGQR
jgi:hypothetical protein